MQSSKEKVRDERSGCLNTLTFLIASLLLLLLISTMRPPPHLTILITAIGFSQESAQTDEKVIIFSNELLVPITLCLGKDHHCDQSTSGPSTLASPGLTIQPAESRPVVDFYPDDYSITITTPLPQLLHTTLALTVNPPPPPDTSG